MYENKFFLPDGIYLQSHSVGCLPQTTKSSATVNYFDAWQNQGAGAWPAWLTMVEDYCKTLGTLFGANSADFCPQSNVSSALTKILFSLNPLNKELNKAHSKNTLLMSNHDFPSLGFVFSRSQQDGYNIRFLPDDSDLTSLEQWKSHVNDDIKLMLITHVTSDFSERTPVREIIQLAKQKDIITVVDVAQSAGIVPIDFHEWDADFVIGSCIKWLCGGPGAGFLWANPKIVANFNPRDVGWFSHQDPYDFDVHHFKYATGAKRFWGGTPSILPFVIAGHSITCINKIGIDVIARQNQQHSSILLAAAQEQEIKIVSPIDNNRRGGTITLMLSNVANANKLLSQHKVFFDIRRDNCFRFSPHIYNNEEDVDTVAKLLAKLH